ncbi:MAG: CHC2 zinc finger domain-containing protein [Pseudomonadota bacterium]
MIEKETIESVKRNVDLVSLIQSKGISLKKNGKGYTGLCPFHNDTNPSLSVNPTKNLWQCFGCGAGGDVIRFVELFDKVEFPEAVRKLGAKSTEKGLTTKNTKHTKERFLPQTHTDRRGQGGRSTEHGAKSIEHGAKPECKNQKKRNPEPPDGVGSALHGAGRNPKPGTTNQKPETRHLKLLSRVVDFYHTAFAEDLRARDYLVSRGITDNALFSAFKVGFSNGTLLNVLPGDGEILAQLKDLGILNDKGHEHFYGCVTFPLYDLSGNPAGIYARRIPEMHHGNGPDHLYLPGPRRGIFNRQAATLHKEIILTEAVIDSLTLINAGIRNTIACYGTNGLTQDHLTLFRQHQTNTIYTAFDADEAGRQAAASISGRLTAEGLKVHPVNLPDGEDVNSFFSSTAGAADRFKELMQQPGPEPPACAAHADRAKAVDAVKEEKKANDEEFTVTDYGFAATVNGRRYELRGITKGQTKLKATVKGVKTDKGKTRFHVDTVDFYSARSRAFLVKGLGDLFGQDEQTISGDLDRLLELAESYKPPAETAAVQEEMSVQDKEAALAFLTNPNMFEEIISDFETIGYTGEEMNKLLCYIAAISRKMEKPLSIMVQSRSAAGKSYLQDKVLSLMPEEDWVKYTRLTDQALFYKEGKSLVHKILAVEELDGMNGAMYSIRSIQSSPKITIAYTIKDPATGLLRTMDHEVEGPVMIFITTTQPDIDGETANRFVFISMDESEKMTERILEKQREEDTMQGLLNRLASDAITKKHKAANRLLRPVSVLNPYGKLLTFTSKSLRARRDQRKYINLILAIAYLFQYQRKVATMEFAGQAMEYVNVTLADIARANDLAGEVLGRSLDELSPSSRQLLEHIKKMSEKACREKDLGLKDYRFSRRDIREYCGWSDFQVRLHISQLEELEYIYSVAGKRGKEYVYELVYTGGGEDGKPFLIGLIDVDELKRKAEKAGIEEDA